MTTHSPTAYIDRAPVDVAEWLLGDLQGIPRAIGRVVKISGGPTEARRPGHLGRVTRAALGQQILITLRAVLRADIADLLLAGWRKHRTLVTAATGTLAEPDTERLVTLAEHRVHWVHEPTLDIVLDGVRLLTLPASLDVQFEIGEVLAVVRTGRLVALRAGTASLTGAVSIAGQEIICRKVTLQLPLAVRLGTGIDLTTSQSRVRARSRDG